MLASIATTAIALAWAPGASARTVAEPAGERPAEVRDYWTPSRMLAAREMQAPESELPATRQSGGEYDADAASYLPPAGAPAAMRSGSPGGSARTITVGVDRREVTDPAATDVRMHGKVFFTITAGPQAGDRVCSGTAVNSRNRSVVWTAGHCVFDLDSGSSFATNWIFVPGYSAEGAPYGEWPAKRLATTSGWKGSANFRYDVGAAVVTKNAEGERLQDVVGARGIGFDQPRDQRYSAYGYPAVGNPIEFTGDREYRCVSDNEGSDAPVGSGPPTMVIACDMLGGASGGGWIARKTLLSVTSYGYLIEPNRLFGPYLSTAAKSLYKNVSGKRKKRGARAARAAGRTRASADARRFAVRAARA